MVLKSFGFFQWENQNKFQNTKSDACSPFYGWRETSAVHVFMSKSDNSGL